MTPAEHELLTWKMRSLAQQGLLDWLADIFRIQYGMLPEPQRSDSLKAFEKKLSLARADYAEMTLPELHPAIADLQTGLFQESFADLSKALLAKIGAGVTPEERERLLLAAARRP